MVGKPSWKGNKDLVMKADLSLLLRMSLDRKEIKLCGIEEVKWLITAVTARPYTTSLPSNCPIAHLKELRQKSASVRDLKRPGTIGNRLPVDY